MKIFDEVNNYGLAALALSSHILTHVLSRKFALDEIFIVSNNAAVEVFKLPDEVE